MKFIYHVLILTSVTIIPLSTVAQVQSQTFAQLDSLQKTENKSMVIFIHTDWCKYCQSMKNTTFKDKKIIQLLNETFLFADMNGEEKKNIVFNGRTFKYKPTGNNTGVHELAEQLGTVNGKLSYPTLCILNANYEIIFQYDNFISSSDLLKLLNAALTHLESRNG